MASSDDHTIAQLLNNNSQLQLTIRNFEYIIFRPYFMWVSVGPD